MLLRITRRTFLMSFEIKRQRRPQEQKQQQQQQQPETNVQYLYP